MQLYSHSKKMNKDTNFSSDKTICCGKNLLTLSKPMVMGILNCTYDSFFDGGKYTNEKAIIERAENIGKLLRAEDGVGRAVDFIEKEYGEQ